MGGDRVRHTDLEEVTGYQSDPDADQDAVHLPVLGTADTSEGCSSPNI